MKMSEGQIVAHNFKRLRKERGWRQRELAERANVSINYISQVERMHSDFGANGREKWAKVFGVEVCEFFKKPLGDEKEKELSALIDSLSECSLQEIKTIHKIVDAYLGKGTERIIKRTL